MFKKPSKKIVFLFVSFIILSACKKRDAQNPDNLSYEVMGETIALSSDQPSYLLKKDAIVNNVYKINDKGVVTTYKLGTDYLRAIGGLVRTKNSSIPDFSNHKLTLNPNGKFTWNGDPNRNPEISLKYQVMVDYSTKIDPIIKNSGLKMSTKLEQKLLGKQDILIYCIGTSITAGAHTLPSYFYDQSTAVYVQLLAKAITKLYGSKVTIVNLAEGGANTALFTSKLDFMISQNPDLVFVEFGMNEHFAGADDHLIAMENGIKQLLTAGIDCSLIGFFQQNPDWEFEDMAQTVYYNNKLKEMSVRNNIYFADIYTNFELIPKNKIYRDIMGDYLHHPTDFGHKLYFLQVAPLIILEDKKESELMRLLK